jgi:DNA-binding transcriptional regulator YdaS (Cro superfamily)
MDTGKKRSPRTKNAALAQAVKLAGGQKALALKIGRSQASVWEWLFKTGQVSAADAVAIEAATGVPAESICPALAAFAATRGLEIRKAA